MQNEDLPFYRVANMKPEFMLCSLQFVVICDVDNGHSTAQAVVCGLYDCSNRGQPFPPQLFPLRYSAARHPPASCQEVMGYRIVLWLHVGLESAWEQVNGLQW